MIPHTIRNQYKHLEKTFDILNKLNIEVEFYETYDNSVSIYYNEKSKKIKTILRKYFNIVKIGYCAGICSTFRDLDIQKDMIIFNISLKKKYIK